MVDLGCVDLAKLGLCFLQSPSQLHPRLAWATRDVHKVDVEQRPHSWLTQQVGAGPGPCCSPWVLVSRSPPWFWLL